MSPVRIEPIHHHKKGEGGKGFREGKELGSLYGKMLPERFNYSTQAEKDWGDWERAACSDCGWDRGPASLSIR